MDARKGIGGRHVRREDLRMASGRADGSTGEAGHDHLDKAEAVFANILTIQRAMQSGMQAIDGSVGLSGSQLSALWHISATPGLRVTALAAAMCVQHSTASNLLDKLEQRGLIRRERNAQDMRVVGVFLTDHGRRVVKKLPGPMHGRLRNALRDLPAEVLSGLSEGLSALLERLPQEKRRIIR